MTRFNPPVDLKIRSLGRLRMDGNTYPRLHNAMWPGLVGKGPDSEPPIGISTRC